jgi:glutaredoxin-related protein
MYNKSDDEYEECKNKLINQTQWTTFPQIFINNTFIGGYQELEHAYETLKLHELCKQMGYELDVVF